MVDGEDADEEGLLIGGEAEEVVEDVGVGDGPFVLDILGEETDTRDAVEVEVFDLGLEDLGGWPGWQGGERFWLGRLGGEGGFEEFDLFLGEGAELAKFLGGNDHEVGGVEGVFLDGVAGEFEVEMRGE